MSGYTARTVVTVIGVMAVAVTAVCGCGRSADQASPPVAESLSAPAAVGGASSLDDLGLVGGQPITDVPSGLRPDAPTAIRAVTNTDNGEIDRLAAMAMADIEEFWSGAYGPPLTGKFAPVADLFSWDSNDQSPVGKFCGDPTANFPNAAFCPGQQENCSPPGVCTPSYNTIGWDRGAFIPDERQAFGEAAVAIATLAHETGHAIQFVMSDLIPRTTLVAEQQADCFAGVYARWVTDGKSPRFTLNTGEGLNTVLADVIGSRDPLFTEDQREKNPEIIAREHGSGFERVSAFGMGFDSGTAACAGIDEKEIAARRGNLPVALRSGESGENPVTEESVKVLIEALNKVSAPADPPALSFTAGSCPDAKPSPPASYCPATNTLTVDIPGLADLATSISAEEAGRVMTLPQFGDYTAYSIVVSRYMLAVQHQLADAPALDTEQAGLRTACLTGVATTKMSDPVTVKDQTIKLTAGDLYEAVAGVLYNGLAAADVNGKAPLKGFARVAALRIGVLGGDQATCLKTFV